MQEVEQRMEQLPSVWTLPPGDADYPLRWGLIKRMVTYECGQHYYRTDWMTASKTKHRESTFLATTLLGTLHYKGIGLFASH